MIFNQFEEFGNATWHYHVTGQNDRRDLSRRIGGGLRSAVGLRFRHRQARHDRGRRLSADGASAARVVATEALQCPTLYQLGFGGHRIEGIGDKHVPWVHNVRNTDMVAAIDDEQCMACSGCSMSRPARRILQACDRRRLIHKLPLVGISGICNLVAAIKTAKYYDMDGRGRDLHLPDRLGRLVRQPAGRRAGTSAGRIPTERRVYDQAAISMGFVTDHFRELTYFDRKALHNFKYFTWVEQQGRTSDEDLSELWDPEFWTETFAQVDEWDRQINAFNERTGVLNSLIDRI